MAIAFKNPPINEVIVASYFDPPLADFRSEHIGLFWEKIKDDFPTVRQQLPVNVRGDFISNETFPMPRYWFIASDEISLIQIQKNAFMFNWRRRNGNEYPRYSNIKPAFDKYYSLFNEFIRMEVGIAEPTINLCELTYINTIEHCEFWKGPRDTMAVIPSCSMLDFGAEVFELHGFNCNYSYKVSVDLQLSIGIRSMVKAQQQNVPGMILEIRASGCLGGVSKAVSDVWFQRAHDAINQCFVRLTSPDIQKKYWTPLEGTP